ncbi:hypothetical protein [Kocuria sp.]|uniref:hypothetical protein n=1 Tax=Kocuria sp. TaxID=1871328 RepID=UPI0026E03127|nr:hypothetical protein [Kocuria sp.]MDO5619748.1 hypothetical protein [Kocuria sp.]
MSILRALSVGALGGAAITGHTVYQGSLAYKTVNEWAEQVAADDRFLLLNNQPLPPLEEPPLPAPPAKASHLSWLIPGLVAFIIPPILGAVLFGSIGVASGEPGAGPIAAIFGLIGGLVIGVPLGGLSALTARAITAQGYAKRRITYDTQVLRHEVWAARQDALEQLAAGYKPVAYLDAIGIDPQRL